MISDCKNISIQQVNNHPVNRTSNTVKIDNTKKQVMLMSSLADLAVGTTMLVKYHKGAPIRELKANYQRIIEQFPNDRKYYETLAQGINLKRGEEYRLASITGPQQLESILKKASARDFYLGRNLEGVRDRTLRINLHNHTTASDGYMTPESILDQSARWADEVLRVKGNDGKPPFVIGITDHDTLTGTKQAVRIISENPEKYKNLKVVLGAEISVSHINPTDVKEPMNFELIGYSLNPFNKKMNEFLKGVQTNRQKVVTRFTDQVREQYPQYDFNEEDARGFHRNLQNMRTNGVIYLQEEYINHKIMFTDFVSEINKKIIPKGAEKINPIELFQESKDNYYYLRDVKGISSNIPEYYRDYVLTPYLTERGLLNESNQSTYKQIFETDFTDKKQVVAGIKQKFMPTVKETNGYIISPKELFDVAKESGEQGFFGVAHPGLINASMFSEDVSRVCDEHHYDKGEHLAWRLYHSLKTLGGDYFRATEANYQSYPHHDKGAIHWQKYMGQDKAKEFKLLKAGGIDCHKPSIFKKHTLLTEDEIRTNHLEHIV